MDNRDKMDQTRKEMHDRADVAEAKTRLEADRATNKAHEFGHDIERNADHAKNVVKEKATEVKDNIKEKSQQVNDRIHEKLK